jgi:hypothetical protein
MVLEAGRVCCLFAVAKDTRKQTLSLVGCIHFPRPTNLCNKAEQSARSPVFLVHLLDSWNILTLLDSARSGGLISGPVLAL